jgi:hypothetical protein
MFLSLLKSSSHGSCLSLSPQYLPLYIYLTSLSLPNIFLFIYIYIYENSRSFYTKAWRIHSLKLREERSTHKYTNSLSLRKKNRAKTSSMASWKKTITTPFRKACTFFNQQPRDPQKKPQPGTYKQHTYSNYPMFMCVGRPS